MVQVLLASLCGALPTSTFFPLFIYFSVPSMRLPPPPIERASSHLSIDALVLYLIHPKNQPRCPRDYSHQYTLFAPDSRCTQENLSTIYYPLSRLLFSFQGSDFFHAALFLLPHSRVFLLLGFFSPVSFSMCLYPSFFGQFEFAIFSRGDADISIQPMDLLGLLSTSRTFLNFLPPFLSLLIQLFWWLSLFWPSCLPCSRDPSTSSCSFHFRIIIYS